MPTSMRGFLPKRCLSQAELYKGFKFLDDLPVLKLPGGTFVNSYVYGNLLFDIKNDYNQCHPIKNEELEQHMIELLKKGLAESEADEAQYIRLGLK